jgi:hypothetical protein
MDEELAAEIARFGAVTQDPVWRPPLWDPYDKLLEGKIADLTNILWRAFRVLDHGGSVPAPLRPIKHSFTFDLHFQGAFGGLRGFRPVSSAEGFIQRCLQKAMQWISPKFL